MQLSKFIISKIYSNFIQNATQYLNAKIQTTGYGGIYSSYLFDAIIDGQGQ